VPTVLYCVETEQKNSLIFPSSKFLSGVGAKSFATKEKSIFFFSAQNVFPTKKFVTLKLRTTFSASEVFK
jgi:hypothetical protein